VIVAPVAAAFVAAVFAVATYRAAKPADVALRVWSVALVQFAIACSAVVWGVGFGWTPMVYRAFYLFGAVLNVAWLALGTAWLFVPRRVAMVLNALFIVAATVASGIVLSASLASTAMSADATSSASASSRSASSSPPLRACSRVRVISRCSASGWPPGSA
jgi:hypothetical protein